MGGALRFLTVLPVPGPHRPPTAATLVAFPLVGGLVGLVWVAVAGTDLVFGGPLVPAALVLIADALLTGGLHLDGLADVADGVASRRPRDEAVEVMRDSAVGAAGALALALVSLLRFVALLALLGVPRLAQLLPLIAAPVTGRAAMVLLLALVPPPAQGSLASALTRPTGNTIVAVTALAAFLCAVVEPLALVALAAGALVTLALAGWWRGRFGTLVGDAVGACGVVAETVALLALVVVTR